MSGTDESPTYSPAKIPELTPELRARLDRLSPQKRELALNRLRDKSNRDAVAASKVELRTVDREQALPLSFGQQRLWVLHEMDRRDAAYNISSALVLNGDLRFAALQDALDQILSRHEVLRTSFSIVDGLPVQKINSSCTAPLTLEELTHLPDAERMPEARHRAEEEARQPFDLRRAPQVRCRVLRLSSDRHVVLLTLHHIVADGASIATIVEELEILYRAAVDGMPPPLDAPTWQYGDYACWQREAARSGELELAFQYWSKQLQDAPPVLELPTDHPHPPVRSGRGATVALSIDASLLTSIDALARKAGATRFMLLLSAYYAFLYRLTGQQDVIVGSPLSGRTRREFESMVGFFVNTLPLRCRLSPQLTFRQLLDRVRRVVLDAASHEQLPFEQLVERLQPDRHASHTPIFQVSFGYQETPAAMLELPGLEVTPLELSGSTSKYDLTLLLDRTDAGLTGVLEYSADLFTDLTAQRLARSLVEVLRWVTRSSDGPLAGIPLLSAEDELEVLRTWCGQTISYPGDRPIHDLFEAQAMRQPETAALVTDHGVVTYRELNERANVIAHALIDRSLDHASPVGICMQRSPDLLAGFLGILKAGCAYVPLDPEYPPDRLRLMIQDAAPSVVLADRLTAARVSESCHTASVEPMRVDVVRVDLIDTVATKNPGLPVESGQVAYIMYTSGSTGEPKGVQIPHRAVVRLVHGAEYIEFSDREVFLQFAPVCFDASTFEVWGSLLHGARLVIPPPQALSLDQLGEQIQRHEVTTLWLTAGLFQLMVDERLDDLRGLRHLLAGGDVLSVPHLQKAQRALPNTRLVNGYGPTENTTFTCCHTIVPGDGSRRSIPIGRPIANTRVYIVDDNLRLVPPGVPGDLLTGGDGLFLGYLNRPDLDQQALIPDPFSTRSTDRLYRTGDRARYLPDGTIEFLGRADEQVKIRGFRVEPGEIQSVLGDHPSVREAVVVPFEQADDSKELAGYVVLSQETTAHAESERIVELQHWLEQQLPAPLVPASLTAIDTVPLSDNGKVDRQRLPRPAPPQVAEEARPQTTNERHLADVWKQVLGTAVGSVDASFFDLGGNSLRATQVVSRIRTHYSVGLEIHDLFQYPTLRSLSLHVDRLQAEQDSSAATAVPIERVAVATDLSFAQERLWFLYRLEPDNPFYNVAFAHRVGGPLDLAALEQSFASLIKRHQVLRTAFVETDGRVEARVLSSLEPKLQVHDLRHEHDLEGEILRHARQEARAVFDLTQPPLLRATVLVTGVEQHVLLMTMHHIVADGWSLGVVVRELIARYGEMTATRTDALPPLPIQYADYARWQRRWFAGDEANRQLSYWRDHLANFPVELALPLDRTRPPVQTFHGSSVRFEIDDATTRRLRQLARRNDATMFMVLLASFNLLLYRYSNQEDIVVGSPIANRNRDDVESLIGFFVNTLALRTDLSGDPSFNELLARTRHTCLEAYAYQDFPFEKLVDELRPERDLSRNPLFQVMFALQNAPEEELAIPGLSFLPLEMQRTAAQFDLVLDMWEQQEGLLGILEFNTDLFDESTIQRMVNHLTRLLQGVAEDGQRRLHEHPLLSDQETHRILVDFAGPRRAYPVDCTIHELVEQTVERNPDRIAAVHRDETITYGALNERANRIAHALRADGLQANQFVGILEPRGIEFLAAMLATLKAGGAFMPIDADYPADRIRHMLQDSQVGHLITRSGRLEQMARSASDQRTPCQILLDDMNLEDFESANPPPVSTSRDVAYLLYTSGSTGSPRGAMVRHDGAINHIFGESDLLAFHPETVFLQSAPASSDISVWQFLAPLLKGGRSVIADYEIVCDPARLLHLIQREAVTLIEVVPVLMQELLSHVRSLDSDTGALPNLEWAMVTGEAVPVPLVNQWIDTYPDIQLVNAYGPTEAADDTAQYVVEARLPADRRSVPIGKPLPNMIHYVLDPQLNLVPIGVAGEICVSGIGVGKGYWNDEAGTAASFVGNPHHPTGPEGRHHGTLYRTGDRGFWRPDGTLEFLERVDTQVKIRGFRMELGEVEARLTEHPLTREAAVIIHDDGSGEKSLSGYCVADLPSPQTRQILTELRTRQIALWKQLHEDSYQSLAPDDPTFNTIGWDSNYTGRPLPDADMRQYVEHTVERITSMQPQHVLEIGCGTGLLMFPLLPRIESYTGLDLSQVAIDQLQGLQDRSDLCEQIPGLSGARLLRRAAHELTDLEATPFDHVVLPSVVQYFPGIQYLSQVLEAWVPRLAEGGSLFIGDVRSLNLLETFHASVQLFKAGMDDRTADVMVRTHQRLDAEQELAIAPGYFTSLPRWLPRISHVEILPKRGSAINEMTRFRYDVAIYLDGAPPPPAEVAWRDWSAQEPSIAELERQLREERPALAAWSGIGNARVSPERHLLRLMGSDQTYPDKAALVAREASEAPRALDPESLWALAGRLPYRLQLSMARSGEEGTMDALFVREDVSTPVYAMPTADEDRPEEAWANNPLQEQLARRIQPELRQWLREKLPAYMVPSNLILLSNMPVTPVGKIDRQALATLGKRPAAPHQQRPPRTEAEHRLVEIWSEVLGIDVPDITANFFDLGGHSLKATQVASRIRRDFDTEIPLRELFSLPTIEELAAHLATGQSDVTGVALADADFDGVGPAPPADHYPLSHAQRRLWILAQIDTTSIAYNMPASLRVHGSVDVQALTSAFEEVVRRHESLRTRFVVIGDNPRQVVDHDLNRLSIEHVDLTGETDAETRARSLAEQDATRPFDLSRDPLVRLSILTLSDAEHVLLFNMHHIIADEWSLALLVRDLGALYRAIHDGAVPRLETLPVQYKDYAVWQHRRLGAQLEEEDRSFWLDRFQTVPEPLEMPTDAPRPLVKTFHGRSVTHTLDGETAAGLRAFSTKNGVSLFMPLVTCVAVLLHRHSGQRELTIGLPTAGRSHVDLEGVMGYFINALPLQLTVEGHRSLHQLLLQTAQRVTDCLEHQMYPMDRLIDELQLRRDPSRDPLFDVTVTLQNVDAGELSLPGARLSGFVEDYDMSKFDLSFTFQEAGAELELAITYNTDLFNGERVEGMTRHFGQIVRKLLEDPDQTVAELDILPSAERRQAMRWSSPQVVAPKRRDTLTTLFAAQAQRHSDRIAVVGTDPDETGLAYRELHERSNRLARYLQGCGVRRGDRVGLYMERSVEVVVSILGILKTGAAYVPLDPMVPAERVRYMIEDAQIALLVTRRGAADDLPLGPTSVVDLVTDADAIMACSCVAIEAAVDAEDVAYIIYTSGSTGDPKGVVVTHANVTRLFQATESLYGFSETDTWTLFHSYAFDFSVWELWGALLHGGRLIVVPQQLSRSPHDLLALLAREGVTVLNQTPSAFCQLLVADRDTDRTAQLSLRYVIFGGEELDVERLRPWLESRGVEAPQLINMYGITETTVHVTHRPVQLDDLDKQGSRIGGPIPDLTLYIVDPYGHPAPLGVPGEIWVGGAGVAAGYLDRQELTAEKFISDPFSTDTAARVYRSGDVGRLLTDGDVEYLGRMDSQIQLRGFRVELGEIETRLNAYPGVHDSIVVTEQKSEEVRLVAYCVVNPEGAPDAALVRGTLADQLPYYMVPAHILFLDAIPLTVNGKLDRQRLPTPAAPVSTDTHLAPSSPAEQSIADVLASVLEVDRVSCDANFFELGAHSMSIISVQRYLRQQHGMDVPVVAFYEFPTVAALARHVADDTDHASSQAAASARGARRRGARQRRRG